MSTPTQTEPLPLWLWVTFTYLFIIGLIQSIGVVFSIYALQFRHPTQLLAVLGCLILYHKVNPPQ